MKKKVVRKKSKARSTKKPARRTTVRVRRKAAAPATVVLAASAIPAIGKPWPGTNWLRMAEMAPAADGQPGYHLDVLADDTGKAVVLKNVEYGCYGTEIPGANSRTDGLANTEAMLKAGSPLAQAIRKHGEECYLGAIFENQAVCANNRGQIPKDAFLSSTQDGANRARFQHFENGDSYWYYKYGRLSAFVVRRVPIQVQ